MESNRQKKVARLIQKDLADIFLQETKNYYQGVMITITHVFVSKDFSVAKIYLSLSSIMSYSSHIQLSRDTDESSVFVISFFNLLICVDKLTNS